MQGANKKALREEANRFNPSQPSQLARKRPVATSRATHTMSIRIMVMTTTTMLAATMTVVMMLVVTTVAEMMVEMMVETDQNTSISAIDPLNNFTTSD